MPCQLYIISKETFNVILPLWDASCTSASLLRLKAPSYTTRILRDAVDAAIGGFQSSIPQRRSSQRCAPLPSWLSLCQLHSEHLRWVESRYLSESTPQISIQRTCWRSWGSGNRLTNNHLLGRPNMAQQFSKASIRHVPGTIFAFLRRAHQKAQPL